MTTARRQSGVEDRGDDPDESLLDQPGQLLRPEGEEQVSLLLVDDRGENLLALEAILEPLGQHMVRASSGDDALKEILNRDFAVILMDVQMPGMNGFETARLVKSRERSRHIPIIFLTAINKDEAHVFQGYEAGAVDYMAKPFDPDVLRSKVAVFVDLYRKQQQLKRQERMLRESERRELELRHRAELLESEAKLAQIVSSALDAILTLDGEGTVTLCNSAAEGMFGWTAKELLGRPVSDLFRDWSTVESMASNGTEKGAGRVVALNGLRHDSETFPAEASVSQLGLGDTTGYTVIVRDVSERQRTEEALRTQAASLASTTTKLTHLNNELQHRQMELQRAMSARNRFYAAMSHELRTPINAILGYGMLLIDGIYGPLNERQKKGLTRSHKAANHLLELVNDVLDLSKIEAGKIDLLRQPVTFPTVVEDLFVTVGPLADQHGSVLTLRAVQEPITVTSDPRRVRQILLNLLSNAIKFGRGHPIEVWCELLDDGSIVIAVRDHGDGISEDDLERIFEEFVQLPQPGAGGQGTGLGLPISRRLARLLGGDLQVESRVGEGSTFRLLLPARLPESSMATPAEQQAKQTTELGEVAAPSDAKSMSPAIRPPRVAESSTQR